MAPTSKLSPGCLLDVRVTSPELSLAVGGIQVTVAAALLLLLLLLGIIFWVISDGVPEMTGISISVIQNYKDVKVM